MVGVTGLDDIAPYLQPDADDHLIMQQLGGICTAMVADASPLKSGGSSKQAEPRSGLITAGCWKRIAARRTAAADPADGGDASSSGQGDGGYRLHGPGSATEHGLPAEGESQPAE